MEPRRYMFSAGNSCKQLHATYSPGDFTRKGDSDVCLLIDMHLLTVAPSTYDKRQEEKYACLGLQRGHGGVRVSVHKQEANSEREPAPRPSTPGIQLAQTS